MSKYFFKPLAEDNNSNILQNSLSLISTNSTILLKKTYENNSTKKILTDSEDVGDKEFFSKIREKIIGIGQTFHSPYGEKKLVYTDWIASGRLYESIEKRMGEMYPLVGNTHTETSITGTLMTKAYHNALDSIKRHCGANSNDVIISEGSGMTGVINKFQRILGIRVPERMKGKLKLEEHERPIIFITHMEHHSNYISWLETIAEVKILESDNKGNIDLLSLQESLQIYQTRPLKIASITGGSNVTGVVPPFHEIAEIMHKYGGFCLVDFACSAPYIKIDMHPMNNPNQSLDAIFFSPHKFLGGPGTSGITIFTKLLYNNKVPDNSGGGTVNWTNPWGDVRYTDNIEAREDGGTPAFLQTIKAALCMQLKDEIGVERIMRRENFLIQIVWEQLSRIPNLHILAGNVKDRLGVISFYIDDLNNNVGVRILNDRFGIQCRGGTSCAGTYAHYLFNISVEESKKIADAIDAKDSTIKIPGWIRFSVHPTMSDGEAYFVLDAIKGLAENHYLWAQDYVFNPQAKDFQHKSHDSGFIDNTLNAWFRPICENSKHSG